MVRRLGIGGASASAVVFSVILLSNLALFAASQNRATLYSQSDASDMLGDEAEALTGSAATNILLEVESFLAAGAMDCSAATGQLSAHISSLVDIQESRLLNVSATAEFLAMGSPDNLSIVFPFNGSAAGELSLAVTATAKSGPPIAQVSYSRSVLHEVHLPVRWASEVRDCLDSLSSVSAKLSDTRVANCTAGEVTPAMEAATSGPASAATADGFVFGYSYSIADPSPCTVNFRITVEQAGVEGPGGAFNVLLSGEGAASFA